MSTIVLLRLSGDVRCAYGASKRGSGRGKDAKMWFRSIAMASKFSRFSAALVRSGSPLGRQVLWFPYRSAPPSVDRTPVRDRKTYAKDSMTFVLLALDSVCVTLFALHPGFEAVLICISAAGFLRRSSVMTTEKKTWWSGA